MRGARVLAPTNCLRRPGALLPILPLQRRRLSAEGPPSSAETYVIERPLPWDVIDPSTHTTPKGESRLWAHFREQFGFPGYGANDLQKPVVQGCSWYGGSPGAVADVSLLSMMVEIADPTQPPETRPRELRVMLWDPRIGTSSYPISRRVIGRFIYPRALSASLVCPNGRRGSRICIAISIAGAWQRFPRIECAKHLHPHLCACACTRPPCGRNPALQ